MVLFAQEQAKSASMWTATLCAWDITTWWIISVMILGGLVGGFVGHLTSPLPLPDGKTLADLPWYRRPLCVQMISGLVAAFLVPLFLNSISSTLFKELISRTGHPADIFLFLGFCLVAGISAQAFITRLSSVILNKLQDETEKANKAANDAAKKAKEAQHTAAQAIERLAEPPKPAPPASGATPATLDIAAAPQLSAEELTVLRAVHVDGYAFRDLNAISLASQKPESVTEPILKKLTSLGLLEFAEGMNERKLWGFTSAGKSVIANANGQPSGT